MTLTGEVRFVDIGPGYYELVTPTCIYRLVGVEGVLSSLEGCENQIFTVNGKLMGDIYTVGGTGKATLMVSTISV